MVWPPFCNILTERHIFPQIYYILQKVVDMNREKHLEKAKRMEKS